MTRLAGALLRGLHLAASLKARAQLVIQLHALQKAPLSRACLRQLSRLLTLIKVRVSPVIYPQLSSYGWTLSVHSSSGQNSCVSFSSLL